MTSSRLKLLLAAMAVAAGSLFAQAPVTLVIVDPPGVGFNDPTPAEPVGGNSGLTIGEQRVIAFRYAAAIWSSKLESPVPIRVRARFGSLPCTEKTGFLAATGPTSWYFFRETDPEIIPNVWYPAALANRLAETVLDPDVEEISTVFNSDFGQPGCVGNQRWYYGLDNRATSTQADMVATLLHELAHGLGFGPMATSQYSAYRDRVDIFTEYVLDTGTGKPWKKMTDEERETSAANAHAVVWNGINVRKSVPSVLRPGKPTLRIAAPSAIARDYYVQTATFGTPLSTAGLSGEVAVARDESNADGPSATDACSPILNAAEVTGRIALVDRGTCSFADKARNVQTAGAIAMIAANNEEGTFLLGITGEGPDITIPLVHITHADGDALKAALAGFQTVTAGLLADPNAWAGADRQARPMLYNTTPATTGSTMCHWDPIASPNQLMEPDIQDDLTYSVEPPRDLTLPLMRDLGWFADFDGVPDGIDQCPGSSRSATVILQGCDTGVTNFAQPTGCRLSDYFKPCENAAAATGDLGACVSGVSRQLMDSRTIGPRESQKIQACVEPVEHP